MNTLYNYFWNTLLDFSVSQCCGDVGEGVAATTEASRFNETEVSNRSSKAINVGHFVRSTYVPANLTANTVAPSVAPPKYKTLPKKLLHLTNTTRKQANLTLHARVKDMSVIDSNATTDSNSNLNETQGLVTGNFSIENATLIEGDGSNQTLLLSSEEIIEEPAASDNLSAAGITGITLGCVSFVAIVIGVSFFLYRNRGFNRPQVLNDHCSNLDSSGYIDDTSVRVSFELFLVGNNENMKYCYCISHWDRYNLLAGYRTIYVVVLWIVRLAFCLVPLATYYLCCV